jgi:RimJ/RimL family protein N-acetyltransferase
MVTETETQVLTFERTRDWELVREIFTNPRIYGAASDDFSPAPEHWKPIEHEDMVYLLVRDGEELLGMFVLIPHNRICWDVHTCLLPVAYGSRAREAAKGAAAWVFEHTMCIRIVTEVPEYNHLAYRFAQAAGMTEYGFNPRAYKKSGQLCGVHLLGMSKPGAK